MVCHIVASLCHRSLKIIELVGLLPTPFPNVSASFCSLTTFGRTSQVLRLVIIAIDVGVMTLDLL